MAVRPHRSTFNFRVTHQHTTAIDSRYIGRKSVDDWPRNHENRKLLFGPPCFRLQGILPARDLGCGPIDVAHLSGLGMGVTLYLFHHAFIWVHVPMHTCRRFNRFCFTADATSEPPNYMRSPTKGVFMRAPLPTPWLGHAFVWFYDRQRNQLVPCLAECNLAKSSRLSCHSSCETTRAGQSRTNRDSIQRNRT